MKTMSIKSSYHMLLYVSGDILLTSGKHLHDRIISLRGHVILKF